MRFFKSFLGVLCCIVAFILLIGSFFVEQSEFMAIPAIIYIILAILLFRRTKADKEKYAKKYNLQPKITEDFKTVENSFPHTAGLPVAPGAICILNLKKTGLSIHSSGVNFNLAIDKIISISTKTETEIQNQKQYVSSTGRAIAGAALFGLPGAIIGGRAREKNITTTTYKNFMVVTYKKGDSIEYLLFALSSPMDAMPFITNFGILAQGRKKQTNPRSITKPISSPQIEGKTKQIQPEAKEPQQYIINKNTIEKAGGEITKNDVPYLIELSYQEALRQEVNSTNPKFHRTDSEEELAFNFYSKYVEQINRLVNLFENPYHEESRTYNYQDKIALLELAIENFDKAKKWCYSKGKGGQIHFDDMWMNLHNSQTECFSYATQIQHRLDFIKTLMVIRQQILDIVNQTPGILQKDIYKFFNEEQKSDVVYAIKDLVKDDCLLKEKKGNSYSLTALVSQDVRNRN